MNRLHDRVCIVTGAARGIGKGIAKRFLEEGASVWIADINEDGIEVAVAELAALGPVAGGVADVGQREQVEAMVEATVGRFGKLDVLVNNAGIAHHARFVEIEDADWDRVLDTNLRGAFLGTQIAARRMIAQGTSGAIVNIASTNGLRGQPMLAPYGASKAGIINLSQTAALELGRHGIRVNALCPGTIWNEMSAQSGWDDELWTAIRSHTALDTFGTPADIAAAAAFLASDDARFVTGAVMVVDGGLTARQLNIDEAITKLR
ncbi:MAG TPA: SDR family NAD(P)-dependent oxidoreductase [Thermomicrobiales bacterium]